MRYCVWSDGGFFIFSTDTGDSVNEEQDDDTGKPKDTNKDEDKHVRI